MLTGERKSNTITSALVISIVTFVLILWFLAWNMGGH